MTGKLDQQEMLAAYEWSHIVVVPTTADFAEGLNKVAVEGVLAGRPVLASRYSHALDVLGRAVIEVDPDRPNSFVEAITKLMDDPDYYCRCVEEGCKVSQVFYNSGCSWAAALRAAIGAACVGQSRRTGT